MMDFLVIGDSIRHVAFMTPTQYTLMCGGKKRDGDRVTNLHRAVSELSKIGSVVSSSHLYQSKPFGGVTDQPLYLNAAVQVDTSLDIANCFKAIKNIEKLVGRREGGARWGPRELDIDILFYGNESGSWDIVGSDGVTIPHKGIGERDFVLQPLCDIDPLHHHPVYNCSVSDLLRAFKKVDKESIQRVLPVGKDIVLPLGTRTYIMGILNTTPDSFSDGGLYGHKREGAVDRALEMEEEGSTFIDVGGESTRPNSERVEEEEEIERVVPVVSELKRRLKPTTIITVDTTRSKVAQLAVEAGAHIINDISAGLYDPNMMATVFKLQVPIMIMHTRGTSKTMTSLTGYNDLVADVSREMNERVKEAEQAGIPRWMITADPGIGFAKNSEQNIALLRHLSEFRRQVDNLPLLVGTSRKGFIGTISGEPVAKKRGYGTAATCTAAIAGGADILRVHDVKEMRQVSLVSDAIYR